MGRTLTREDSHQSHLLLTWGEGGGQLSPLLSFHPGPKRKTVMIGANQRNSRNERVLKCLTAHLQLWLLIENNLVTAMTFLQSSICSH